MGEYYCFCGTDGVGKTTVLDLIQKNFDPTVDIRHVSYFIAHNKFIKKTKPSSSFSFDFKTGYSKKKRNKYVDFLSLLILMGEFIVFFNFYLLFRSRKRTLILDRSPIDLFILGNKHRFNILENIFFFFIPKPKNIFLLKDDYEKIYQRKPQRSLNEMRHYYKTIEQIMKKESVSYSAIDVGRGPEETYDQIIDFLKK
jgi:thymidylate kinase